MSTPSSTTTAAPAAALSAASSSTQPSMSSAIAATAPNTPAPAPAAEPAKPAERAPSRALGLAREMQRQEALQQSRQQLKAIQGELEQLKSQVKERDLREARFRADPMEAVKHYGHKPEDIAKMYANNGVPTVDQRIQQLERELVAERSARADERKRDLESLKAQKEQEDRQLLETHHQNALRFVQKNADKYPLIANRNDGASQVIAVLDEALARGRFLTEDEACALVEEHYSRELENLARLPKVAERFAPKASTPQAPAAAAQPMAAPTTTIGSDATGSMPTPSGTGKRTWYSSEREQMEAGMRVLHELEQKRKR